MATWKQLLLQEAARRFEDQKRENDAEMLMAPISPTPQALVEEALHRVASECDSTGAPLIKSGSVIVDLGCGDGRWLLAAARKYPKVRCVGYDLDTVLLEKGRAFLEELQRDGEFAATSSSVEFEQQDLMVADVSQASLVVAYLFREGCAAVIEKLERELPPAGSAVLSVGFALRKWEARWTLRVPGCVPCYFYTPVSRSRHEGSLQIHTCF